MFSSKTLAGPGYIILNIIRGMNITALVSVCAACIVMLVKTFIVSKFFFFDAASHVITAIISLALVVSEMSLFKNYFAKTWPLLSADHGFGFLSASMFTLGINMLGNLNKEATSQESLGMEFWRIVIASGILSLIMGLFNLVATFVFRDKGRRVTSRMVRAHGATVVDGISGLKPIKTQNLSQPYIPSPEIRSPLKVFSPMKAFRASKNFRSSFLPTHHFPGRSKRHHDEDEFKEPEVIGSPGRMI